MTLRIIYQRLAGTILTDISDVSTLLPIDLITLAAIEDAVNFGAGEWTYLTISNGSGSYVEEVKVTGTSGNNLVIVRGRSGSTPRAFTAIDAYVTNVTGEDAIKDIITQFATPPVTTVSATGAATSALVGNNYNIYVPIPEITGSDGIDVTGSWPRYNIAFVGIGGGCCAGCGGGSGGGGGIDTLDITSDILQGSILANVLRLSLQTPAFTGAVGITVTGTYPNFTITGSAAGTGTVTSVAAGTGITVTGAPAINPTVAITNTGVTAGNYAGLVINAQGQIVTVPAGFNPLSNITADEGISVVITGGVAALTVADAAVGVDGIVALADSGSPLDPTDDATATTPKVVAAAIAAAATGGTQGNGTSTGEADASYTNTLGATNLAITLAAGKKLALFAECEMLDGGAPLTPVAFGLAIFAATGPVAVYKGKKATQSKQTIATVIVGPLTDTIALVTTAVPGGSTIFSSSLIAIPL
jgi:hypothetical protein